MNETQKEVGASEQANFVESFRAVFGKRIAEKQADAESNRDAKPGKRFGVDDLADLTFRFFGLGEPCDIKRDDADDKNLEEDK